LKRNGYARILLLATIVSLLIWTVKALAEETPADQSRPAIRLELPMPDLKVGLHAELNFDYLGFDTGEQYLEGAGSQESDFVVKRARIGLTGMLWKMVEFKIKAGLELDGPPIIDAYLIYHLPAGLKLHVGQMKVPFSMERLRSYSHQPFMERSLAHTLALRRSRGVYLSTGSLSKALQADLGVFTGESLNRHNTDDDLEYVGRLALRFENIIGDFPGEASIGCAFARGRRAPQRSGTYSFEGKTMNGLTFFSGVPVSGFRTRYEADAEWRWKSLWLAAEYMYSEEERNNVTVSLDTDGDYLADDTVTRDIDPLRERGWMVYAVWVITGEDAGDRVVPSHKWGALGLALRYSAITFDSQEGLIPASFPGVVGNEVSDASEALGRPGIDETVQDVYAGLNWYIRPGLFAQVAVIRQWFDDSSPYGNDDHSDINYRARVGMVF